jgi:pyruvate,water dikinase
MPCTVGGKARALARLAKFGARIPPWFAVTLEAFFASLDPEQELAMRSARTSTERLRALETLKLHPQFQEELRRALTELCPRGELVAVRSSGLDEDGESHSFAGQLESFLCVSPENVAEKILEVWRSGFGEQVQAYCRQNGAAATPGVPAVLIQRMVNAEAAGAAFSADPVTGRRGVAVVSAVMGLGTSLVSGEANADTYHVRRDGEILRRMIAKKSFAHRMGGAGRGGIEAVALEEEHGARAALSDIRVREIADLATRAEAFLGRPQDIEWALEGGEIYLLQSRPITSLAGMPDPDGAFGLWDNSNIVESYGGVTTPLTFTFARQAYEEVYRQFCRVMHVSPKRIEASASVFRSMLGYIRGRIYYNLLKWYPVLALLPGYTWNRAFMEQMMGVRESLPEDALPRPGKARRHERIRDGLRLLLMIAGLVWHHLTRRWRMRKFHERVAEALGTARPDLAGLRADELLGCYRELERKLLQHWDAPLINDFLTMFFHGVLRKLTVGWCGEGGGALHNELLCGEGGSNGSEKMISAVPAARVHAMARLAAVRPSLVETLCHGIREEIFKELQSMPELSAAYMAYLEEFGDRCLDELKLESVTLHDDPLPLLRSIGHLAAKMSTDLSDEVRPEIARHERAEENTREAMKRRPWRRWIYFWVLKNARRCVRDRENLRFERTRVFGRARRIFVELGRRLQAVDRLEHAHDVFYLELEELLGFIEGTASCTNLKGLVALRKAEREDFLRSEVPATRFETRGIVHQGNTFRERTAGQLPNGDRRQGIGCCPGLVRGRVRLVQNPREARPQAGDILVAERTDPGWVLLFPLAAGVLVERGSLLSHSAIVAREMGIPTVVSIEGLTGWLQDSDWVEFDGGSGIVARIPSPERVASTLTQA